MFNSIRKRILRLLGKVKLIEAFLNGPSVGIFSELIDTI